MQTQLGDAKVLHWPTPPVSSPRLNQCTRCAEVPWVKESGVTVPPGLALEAVVADAAGGVERFLDIAFLEDVAGAVGVVGPDTGTGSRPAVPS